MKVYQVFTPKISTLNINQSYYYMDSYKSSFVDTDNKIGITELTKAFFLAGSKWIELLFSLRNKIVSLFGIKTSQQPKNREQFLDNFQCQPNDRIGFFKVFSRTNHEVILREGDKHLNFRVSLLVENMTSKKKGSNCFYYRCVSQHFWKNVFYSREALS